LGLFIIRAVDKLEMNTWVATEVHSLGKDNSM